MAMTAPIPTIRHDPDAPTPGDSLVGRPAIGPSETRRRVTRVLLLRVIVISVVMGLSVWVLAQGGLPVRSAVWFQSGLIAITYLSSIVFGVMLRMEVSPATVVRPMLVADLAVTSLLVYVTGGAQSPYTFLYALSIVSAGALAYRRGAIVVTLASIGALAVVALLAWRHALDLPMPPEAHPWEQESGEFANRLAVHTATLVGVGALAFLFGDQLQRGAETLATTRQAAADLFTLHQDIVRSLAAGLITMAPDGTVLSANRAAAEILDRRIDAIVGRPIESVMPGVSTLEQRTDPATGLQRAELNLAVPSGTIIGVTVSPLRDLHDRVIGRVVNFQDLTELRRLEHHVRRAERLATVGQLAAGIAHEIRNPLAAISGSIELLRTSPQATEDDATLMAIVQREIVRLNELVGDLLDYANPRASHALDFDVGVMVEETVRVARADPAFGAVELVATAAGPLPYHGDAAKLRQVLWNLLRNASDAAALGGKHVSVAATTVDGNVEVVITDDGAGIPADQVAHIFDPFFTTKPKGTGLGLATCHAIVAEHGGRIDVVTGSAGTTMTVTLPSSPASAPALGG